MPARDRSAILGIYLSGSDGRELRVGALVRTANATLFTPSDDYVAMGQGRPILSLAWTGMDEATTLARLTSPADKRMVGTRLPPFFDNLLPEGALREMVERDFGTGDFDNFDVLARLGADLPGAVVAKLEAGSVASVTRSARSPTTGGGEAPEIRFSLSGVQLKFSMTLDRGRLTVPARHATGEVILKTPSPRYRYLPEAEFTAMTLARAVGVETADVALVEGRLVEGIPEEFTSGGPSLAVTRFDRNASGGRVHVEDFAQILGAVGDQKYHKANEATVMRVVRRFSDDPIGGVLEAVRRVTVNLLVGNGDAHLKNWSFMYPRGGPVRLTPAYDLVPTFFYGDDRTALEFGNTRTPEIIGLNRFEHAAGLVQVPPKVITNEVRRTVRQAVKVWPELVGAMPIPQAMRDDILTRLPRLRLVEEICPDFRHEPAPDTSSEDRVPSRQGSP